MAFHPPQVADERDGLAAFIGHNQDAIRALVHGLGDADLDAHPSVSENSLAWLLHHLTVVQRNWLDGVLAAPNALTDEQNAVIYARFEAAPAVGRQGLLSAYDEVCAEVLAAVRAVDPALPVPIPDAPWFPKDIDHWSVRWVWLHLLQEITRHAGHGDLIRESLDGATAYELVAAHDGIEVEFVKAWRPTA